MADFLSAYSVQHWLESCPQGYLEDTVYGRGAEEAEASLLLESDVLRQVAIRSIERIGLEYQTPARP